MAIATQWLTGFEHQVITDRAGSGGGGTNLFSTWTGATIITTGQRNGAAALQVSPTITTAHYVRKDPTAGQKFVCRMGIRGHTRPTVLIDRGEVVVFQTVAAANKGVIYLQGDGKLVAKMGPGTAVEGPVIPTGSYALLEVQIDTSSNPHRIKWKVDGVAQTDATNAVAAENVTQFILGQVGTTGPAFTAYYDDVILGTWTDTAADWYGNGKVVLLKPAGAGTHSFTAGDFDYQPEGGAVTAVVLSPPTDVSGVLDETPVGITDWVRQDIIRSAGYVEGGFGDTTETGVPNAVEFILGIHSTGTAAHGTMGRIVLADGTTVTGDIGASTGVSFSNASTLNMRVNVLTPPTGGWDQTKINGLKWRWGFSGDVTPNAFVDAVFLEIDYPVSASVTHQITASGAATTTGSAATDLVKTISASGAMTTTGQDGFVMWMQATASGTFGGAAQAVTTQFMVSPASGAATTSGSAALVPIQATASGGMTTGGSASAQVVSQASASGSAVTSGAAAVTLLAALSASGALTSAGQAVVTALLVPSASGAMTTAGSAATIQTMVASASGAATTSGAAELRQLMVIAASGTAVTSGAAATIATMVATAAGALSSAGQAVVSALLAPSASGAMTTGGQAQISLLIDLTASGAAVSSGSAALAPILMTAAGSAVTAGSAAATLVAGAVTYQITASGSAVTQGTASVSVLLRASASGAATTTGTAALGGLPATGSGAMTTGGGADISLLSLLSATGALQSSGQATSTLLAHASAAGAMTTTGGAEVSAILGASATGTALTTGTARVSITAPVVASGAMTTTGRAQAFLILPPTGDPNPIRLTYQERASYVVREQSSGLVRERSSAAAREQAHLGAVERSAVGSQE